MVFRIMWDVKTVLGIMYRDVGIYFQYCPLCYSENTIKVQSSLGRLGGKDYIVCSNCGAKWHIKTSRLKGYSLQWAKLEKENIDGKGSELLQRKHPPEFWQQMALEGRKSIEPKKIASQETIKEKEIIKKVIVKIRCPYCQNLYDESLNKCPHCGGKDR